LSALLVFATSAGLSRSPAASGEEHDHGHRPEGRDHPDHDEHGEPHGRAPATLAQLAAVECEHGAILDCNECRYEVGVARLDPALADGLVETYRVATRTRVHNGLRLTGEIQLDLTAVVEVASAGGGRVETVSGILGDAVRASQTLAIIQSHEFGQAQAEFLQARAQLDLARKTHEREKRLSEQQISSQADFLAARNALVAAQASAAAALKKLRILGQTDEQIETLAQDEARDAFGQLTLTSPIDGTILEQSIVKGQLIDPAQTLYRVADLSRVWVWCDVYESDLAALYRRAAEADPVNAEIRVKAFPDETFAATLDTIGSQLERDTRTLKVRLVADNPQGKLKPGMFVAATIDLGHCEDAVHVPAHAVLSDEGRHFVFVKLAEDLWTRRHVELGHRDRDMVEIRRGLADGELIVAGGGFMFKSEVLKEKMGAGCAH
jgi:cobalt-zinc-cadmium efflux system membrane fusion protein